MAHDIVIRGGAIIDGAGGTPFSADLAIDDGFITEIGKVAARGHREIDADGLAVTPGFIDLHTHFDAQVYWDPELTPVNWHGVTTALMGNCGVSFAPCKPGDRKILAGMMETVEQIPLQAMLTGMPWSWEDYGGFLDAVEKVRPGLNVTGMVGHSAVRYYVMGERSFAEPATPEETAQMAAIVGRSIDAGAQGFSTSRHPRHIAPDGRCIPGTYAETFELEEIGKAIAARDGVMQWVGKVHEMMTSVADSTGARMILGGAGVMRNESGKAAAERFARIFQGRDIAATGSPRSQGSMFGLQSGLPFRGETWKKLRRMSFAERLEAINDAAIVASLVEEAKAMPPDILISGGIDPSHIFAALASFPLADVYYLGDGKTPDHVAPASENVIKQAAAAGETFAEFFLRLSRETEGRALFSRREYSPDFNELGELLQDPHIYPGFGDAGAHVNGVMDAGWPSFVLSYWVRERQIYSLAEAVRRITSAAARVLGLKDRGLLAVGMRADVNVLDPDRVVELQPQMVYDFPDGAQRFIQRAEGYKATLVNGKINVLDGEQTGARAGMVLRHAS